MGFSEFKSRNTCVPGESQNHQKYPKISLFTLRFSVTCERRRRRYASIKPLILLGFLRIFQFKKTVPKLTNNDFVINFIKTVMI